MKYKLHKHVMVRKGRCKGEQVVMIGETNLNYDYRIIVCGRVHLVRFPPAWLEEIQQ
jgi:hypothetical protein